MLDPDCSTLPVVGDPYNGWPFGYGMCHCGCGRQTTIAAYARGRGSARRGEPCRFLPGHHGRQRTGIAARFWAKVDIQGPDACWRWLGARKRTGYGNVGGPGGHTMLAHRVAWELTHGPIPVGAFVCHRCDNPPCCNPAHLFIGSPADNMADKAKKGRSPHGEQHSGARLTESDIRAIRAAWAEGGMSQSAIARRFSTSQTTVSLVVRGRLWAHVV